jgi:DNA-binding PucR family transcriptional regulator
VLLQRRVVFEAEHRTRAELVRDILAATMQETEQISERARLFGVDVDRPHLVAVARCEGTRRERVLAAGAALHGKFGGMLAEHDGDLVLVLPDGEETRESDAASMFLNGLRTRLSATVTAGVAGPVCGVAGIAGAYRDGRRCLTLLRALGRSGEVARQADLGVYGLLLSSAAPGDLDRFVRTQIGPLLDHDETNGTVLVPTLDAWFGHGLNMTRTAHALHVHVNTLYQRFERIDKLLGPRWREAEGGLHTQLALRLTALRMSTG